MICIYILKDNKSLSTSKRYVVNRMKHFAEKALDFFSKRIAVVVIVCNRYSVFRCLDSILAAKKSQNSSFDLFISHGCKNETVESLCKQYPAFKYIKFNSSKEVFGYQNIALQYKNVFSLFFEKYKYEKIIIIEDDLEVCKHL